MGSLYKIVTELDVRMCKYADVRMSKPKTPLFSYYLVQ